MNRITSLLVAAIASLGLLAGTGAHAQKGEPPRDAAKTQAPAAKAPAKKPEAPAAKGELMDINSASEKELATLPGIGEVRAKAIVKNRPYRGKNELKDRKIIPEKTYGDIQDRIIAKQK